MNVDDPAHTGPASEADPLLQFGAESVVEPTQLAGPKEDDRTGANRDDDHSGGDGQGRIERLERQIERALIEITTLKSDLATLVSAVEDIRKRTGRRPGTPAAIAPLPARRLARGRTIAAIALLLTAGAALWGSVWVATDDLPEPPSIERTSSGAGEPAPPIESPAPQTPAVVPAAVATPVERARDRPPPVVTYVGTLTVDAEPAGDVFLNRQSVGRTPLRLDNLRAGSHLIWIERDGYRRWTRVVAVAADRVSRVSASLDPVSR